MRKRIIAAALLISLVLCFAACAGDGSENNISEDTGAASVYRISGDGMEAGAQLLIREQLLYPEGEDELEFLINALTAPPEQEHMSSALPEGTEIKAHVLNEGELSLELDRSYLELEGMSKTIADYSMTLTLCRARGVDAVSIYVDGVCYAKGLTADDAVLRDITSPHESRIVLYFPDESSQYLVSEYHTMYETAMDSYESVERYVVERLLDGPITPGLRRVLPEDIRIRSISTSDGVCTVNLYSGFAEVIQAGMMSERLAVYSFVNTLCSLSWVEKVRFQEEGNIIDSLTYLPMKSNFSANETILGPPVKAKEQAEGSIYLRHVESGKLAKIPAVIEMEDMTAETAVIKALVNASGETGFTNLLSAEDMPDELSIKNGICTVSLNEKFFDSRTDEAQMRLAAMAIAATLLELEDVSYVAFNIDGRLAVYGDLNLLGNFTKPTGDIIA